MSKIKIIAEIGINHNGDIKLAKELIDVSVKAGCDIVKFQKRDIENVYSKTFLDSFRESPWGKTQRDQKTGIELSEDDYIIINEYCLEKKIDWFASCWDTKSQILMRKFNLNYNKVASPMLVHTKLLEIIADEKKHTFISTGMSEEKDIEIAVNIFLKKNCSFELMHCVSSYPLNPIDANLNYIKTLKNKFKCNVGYSGHETGIGISIAAAALGISSLERHITLDRTMYGSDQAASIEPNGLNKLVEYVRSVEKSLGDGSKKFLDVEKKNSLKLREILN